MCFPRQHGEEILRVLGQGRISLTRVLDLSYNNLGHVFPLLLDNLRFLNKAVLRGSLRRYKLVTSILTSLKMQGSRLKSLDLSENPFSGRDGWMPPALLASSVHHLQELRLQRVHFTDGQVHALFSSLPGTLKVLDLGEVDLAALPPQMVARLAGVEEVNLSNTSLTKEQVEALLSTLPPVKKKTNTTENSDNKEKESAKSGDSESATKDRQETIKDSKDTTKDSKDTTKDSKDTTKDSKDTAKDSKDATQDSKGATQDSKGTTKDSKGTTKDSEGKPKDPIIIMRRLSLQGNTLSGMMTMSFQSVLTLTTARCQTDQTDGTDQLAGVGGCQGDVSHQGAGGGA